MGKSTWWDLGIRIVIFNPKTCHAQNFWNPEFELLSIFMQSQWKYNIVYDPSIKIAWAICWYHQIHDTYTPTLSFITQKLVTRRISAGDNFLCYKWQCRCVHIMNLMVPADFSCNFNAWVIYIIVISLNLHEQWQYSKFGVSEILRMTSFRVLIVNVGAYISWFCWYQQIAHAILMCRSYRIL